jgi:hypothetical protein
MIVERAIWGVKHECRDEFIKLVKAAFEEQDVTFRISSYIYGPWDTVIVDTEFETEEEQQKFKYDWSKPKFVEFVEKHDAMIRLGPINELLQVH